MSSALQRLLGRLRTTEQSVRESIAELVQEAGTNKETGAEGENPGLDIQERALIANVLRLREITADDVMVPRPDIIAIRSNSSFSESIALIRREGHSRLPVYRDHLDDILGMVHIKDVFAYTGAPETFTLESIIRKPLMVAPQISVLDLLLQMRLTRTHLALVVDEYGGIDGLVTIEDLVETIVGDIADEHDEAETPAVIRQGDGSFLAIGRASLDDVRAMIGEEFDVGEAAQDVDTLGGYLVMRAGHVPVRGELVPGPASFEAEVLDADPRRVKRVKIYRSKDRRAGGPRELPAAPRPPVSRPSPPRDEAGRPTPNSQPPP